MNSEPARTSQPQYYAFDPLVYGDYVFGVERVSEIAAEMKWLHDMEASGDEAYPGTEACFISRPIKPDVARYFYMESRGQFVLITARCRGEIVGNVMYFLSGYINVKGLLYAQDGGLYVVPAHRKGRVGIKLLEYAETVLERLGVGLVSHGDKALSGGGPDLGKLFTRKGYKPYSVLYVKELNLEKDSEDHD